MSEEIVAHFSLFFLVVYRILYKDHNTSNVVQYNINYIA